MNYSRVVSRRLPVAVTVTLLDVTLYGALEHVTWGKPHSYRPLKECALITKERAAIRKTQCKRRNGQVRSL